MVLKAEVLCAVPHGISCSSSNRFKTEGSAENLLHLAMLLQVG
jgi:hypothetical protein